MNGSCVFNENECEGCREPCPECGHLKGEHWDEDRQRLHAQKLVAYYVERGPRKIHPPPFPKDPKRRQKAQESFQKLEREARELWERDCKVETHMRSQRKGCRWYYDPPNMWSQMQSCHCPRTFSHGKEVK